MPRQYCRGLFLCMKKNYTLYCCLLLCLSFAACNNAPAKRVLIIGKGEIIVNGNTITMKDKPGYAEQTVDLSDNKETVWSLESPTGKTNVSIPAAGGLYIVNMRIDTIVGSKQNFGKELNNKEIITQERLKVIIDSLGKLTTGANVAAGGSNYMILPNQASRISSNVNAKIFGPFTKIPSTMEADKEGNVPELYKFYTNTEMRDLIAHLIEQTK